MIHPVLSHSRIGTGIMHGWGPGSPMSGALARMGPNPGNHGWVAGGVPPMHGAVLRAVPEGKGKAACGAPSKLAGCGRDGEEPVNLEGCGCGGSCGAREESLNSQCGSCETQDGEPHGHPTNEMPHSLFVREAAIHHRAESSVHYRKVDKDGKADPITKEEADATKEAQEREAAAKEAVEAENAAVAALFSTHFENMDCRNIAKYGGSGMGLDPDTMMGIPPAAFTQPCADAPSADDSTPFSAKWGDCAVPVWNEYSGTDPCGALAPSVERSGVECSAIEDQMLAHGRAMLMLNKDIVRWAICLGYGDEDVDMSTFAIYTRFIDVLYGVGLNCDKVSDHALASAFLEISFTSAFMQGWVDRFQNGDAYERLCVTVDVAHTLFHEMMHVAVGIGSSDSVLPVACHPMWLAQSVVKTALRMRYPQARHSACCDGCLSALFWVSPTTKTSLFTAAECIVATDLFEPDPDLATCAIC